MMNYSMRRARPGSLLCLLLCLSLVLSACGGTAGEGSEAARESHAVSAEESNQPETAAAGEAAAARGDWRDEAYTSILLQGSSAEIDGGGATAEGGIVTITQAGTYVLRGSLSDGQIRVEATKNDVVHLVLDGVDITCTTSAAIYSAKADRTVITLAEGAENRIADGADYQYPDSETDEPDAALFAKDDLIITGAGSLEVVGSFHNGIGCKDDLVIESGIISVTAANHGIRGRDSLTVLDGSLTVQAGNDGLQSNNDSGEGKGWILLSGGEYQIAAANDAIQSETGLTIEGGQFHLVTGGGSDATPAADGSYKGLKAGTDLSVHGGSFVIDSADDALHGDNVTIYDGSFQIATGDDGAHADTALVIHGGEIHISQSYEGLEGQTVEITGGTIRLNASDDGINAAGDDSDSGEGRFGRDHFTANDNNHITISGGYIVVNASGDGVDSNGHITMTGGTLLVHGPTSGGDGALDFDGTFQMSGGVLVAAGSSGMAQAPSGESAQPSLQVYFSATQPAGTPVTLADESGAAILTFVPEKDYQNIVISAPELSDGSTYQIYTGGTAPDDSDGFSLGGELTGELLISVTLSAGATRISDSGEAVSGGMGMGGFGPGGMGRQGGARGEGPAPGGSPPDGGPGSGGRGEGPDGGPPGR